MINDIEKRIDNYRLIFEKFLNKVENIREDDQRIIFYKIIGNFAVFRHTGYFSSNKIESNLLKISNNINFYSNRNTFKKKSFLHIMTQCYDSGGHTKVVERWIKGSLPEEEHSLLLTDQKEKNIPVWFSKSLENQKGKIYYLKDDNEINKAIKLNYLASGYEYIVLHIHFCDIVPILAFGNINFKRPVILFNHADHIFWLGVSIADIVAEFRTSGKLLSLNKRGVKKAELLNIPLEIEEKEYKKTESRKLMGLNEEKKIILSIGSSFKYIPFGKYNFIEFALNLLSKHDDVLFIVIGPSKKEEIWNEAYKKSNGRLNAIGTINHSELNYYRAASDLYIESFPFGSATALLDTALMGIPFLSLSTEMESLDVVVKAKAYCDDIAEMISRASDVLYEKKALSLKQEIIDNHCGEGWQNVLKLFLSETPVTHSLHNEFNQKVFIDEYDKYLSQLTEMSYKNKYIVNINDYSRLNFRNKILYIRYIYDIKILNFTLVKKIFINTIISYKKKNFLKKMISKYSALNKKQNQIKIIEL